jgi:hypothetical protein
MDPKIASKGSREEAGERGRVRWAALRVRYTPTNHGTARK